MAIKAPVEEAEYHIKRIKHIPLYDCLVPRLRVYKKPKENKTKRLDEDWETFEQLIEQNA